MKRKNVPLRKIHFPQAGARWLYNRLHGGFFNANRDGEFCRTRGGVTRALTPYGMLLFAAGMKRIDNGESVDKVCNWARRKNNGATEPIAL